MIIVITWSILKMIDPIEALYTGTDPESLKVLADQSSTKMLTQEQKKHERNNKSANRLNNKCAVI